MARVDNIKNFLTDVADSIRNKTGKTDTIKASDFDTEIKNIPTGIEPVGTLEISENGTYDVKEYADAKVEVETIVHPEYAIFYNYQGSSLDISWLRTDRMSTLYDMFASTNLTSVDVSNFDTSNITNMSLIFYYSQKLTDIDISNFDYKNLGETISESWTGIAGMFRECRGLKNIKFFNDNEDKEITAHALQHLFNNCYLLTSIDLSHFIEKKDATDSQKYNYTYPTKVGNMFNGCKAITTININSKMFNYCVTPISFFNGCSNLKEVILPDDGLEIYLPSNETLLQVGSMFNSCSSLETLPIFSVNKTNFNNTGTRVSTQFNYAFYGCTSLKEMDLSNWYVSVQSLYYAFYNCTSLQKLDIRNMTSTSVSMTTNALYGIPTTCKIIVKDDTEKTWWKKNFSAWSSCFVTADEYEAN